MIVEVFTTTKDDVRDEEETGVDFEILIEVGVGITDGVTDSVMVCTLVKVATCTEDEVEDEIWVFIGTCVGILPVLTECEVGASVDNGSVEVETWVDAEISTEASVGNFLGKMVKDKVLVQFNLFPMIKNTWIQTMQAYA